MTTFDPDTDVPPSYDDRPIRIVKEPDPVRQKRNKNNRANGKRAERLWVGLINDELAKHPELALEPRAEARGGLGGVDATWDLPLVGSRYAFELKQRMGKWPIPATIKHAWEQASRHGGGRTPMVVLCKTTHNTREWKLTNDCSLPIFMEGREWIGLRVADLVREKA